MSDLVYAYVQNQAPHLLVDLETPIPEVVFMPVNEGFECPDLGVQIDLQ